MRHAAHVAHHTRGRLRIKVPAAKGNPEALEKVRKSIKSLPGVNDVEVNETIGSVTVHYDPEQHPDFVQHLAGENGAAEAVSVSFEPPRLEDLGEIDELVAHEAVFLAQHSHAAKNLLDCVNSIDVAIKKATGNNIDFKVLAPLVLAVGALTELGVTASTPVWLTLALYSFNHVIELHTQAHGAGGSAQKPAPAAGTAQQKSSAP